MRSGNISLYDAVCGDVDRGLALASTIDDLQLTPISMVLEGRALAAMYPKNAGMINAPKHNGGGQAKLGVCGRFMQKVRASICRCFHPCHVFFTQGMSGFKGHAGDDGDDDLAVLRNKFFLLASKCR